MRACPPERERERERDRDRDRDRESERGDRPAQEARAACGERTTRPGSGEAEQTLWREDRHVGQRTRNSQSLKTHIE